MGATWMLLIVLSLSLIIKYQHQYHASITTVVMQVIPR